MRILLYIPKHTFSVDANNELVTALNVCLNESTISINEQDDQQQVSSEIVHSYSPQMLTDVDIVHIFGCWDRGAANVLNKATKAYIPTVFSPLGGLEPWTIKGKAAKRHLQTNLYQRRMTRQASAIHVAGKFENEMFTRLHWNNHVATIKNPALTSLVSNRQMTTQMLALYRQVIDSNVYNLMSEQAIGAMSHMLHAALCHQFVHMPIAKAEATQTVATITAADWRNICIYAHDECISDFIALGAQLLNPNLRPIDADTLQRFKPKFSYATGSLKDNDVLSSNIMLKSKVEDIASDEQSTERKICMMVLNIKHELAHQQLPLRHIANLAELLLNSDYDEDVVLKMLDETAATKFMARLEAVMETVVRLSEGFMPVPPVYDKQTEKLIYLITKLKNIAVS